LLLLPLSYHSTPGALLCVQKRKSEQVGEKLEVPSVDSNKIPSHPQQQLASYYLALLQLLTITMAKLTLDSTIKLKSGYDIPQLGYGVRFPRQPSLDQSDGSANQPSFTALANVSKQRHANLAEATHLLTLLRLSGLPLRPRKSSKKLSKSATGT
jgi:hypothetical protein